MVLRPGRPISGYVRKMHKRAIGAYECGVFLDVLLATTITTTFIAHCNC